MSFLKKYQDQVNAFVKTCHALAEAKYVTSQGGNLAWKLEDDLILITPTQLFKGDIQAEDVVFINGAGETVEGKRRPTGEKPMYLEFFRIRHDIASVIHCHPPATCAVAIMKGTNWLERPLFPEATIEVGPVPIVPYAEPLTQQLADNFAPLLPKYNNFLMENHGVVSMSRRDIQWTLSTIDLLEGTAQSLLMALAAGEVKELPRREVENLDRTMKARDLDLFGAPGVNSSLTDLYYSQTYATEAS